MDNETIQRLEEKFDRELSEGEAAEIVNTPVVHRDDEDFYEDREKLVSSDILELISQNNGR